MDATAGFRRMACAPSMNSLHRDCPLPMRRRAHFPRRGWSPKDLRFDARLSPTTGLDSVAFAPEALQEIRAAVEQAGISPLVYSLVNGEEKVFWVAGTENEGIRYYFDNRQGDKRFTPVGSSDELYQGEIFYFTCIGEREELLPVYESLCREKQVHCTLQQELYREEYWCELMPGKASKAAAVLRLRELLHAERVIAFGDAINDLPLFEAADEGYAVANAVPELKERADGIIASNDADGVVNWLQAFWSRQNEA